METRPGTRILHLCTADDVGGMQRVVIDLARAFRAAGADVRCVFPRSEKSHLLQDWADEHGARIEFSDALLDAAAPHTWSGVWRLRRFVREAGADVVNIHYGDNFMSLKDLIALRLARSGSIVAAVYHPTDWRESGRLKRTMTRIAGRQADRIIVPSEATAAVLADAGIDPKRLAFVPLGVQPPARVSARDDSRDKLGLPRDAFVVGTLARLTAHKGIDDLIAATITLADPGITLAVGGDGEDREALAAMAGPLGDRARFLGRVPDATDLYAASDVFCLPSRLEGFGLVYVEAAMAGVPSIAADAGAVGEVVRDGETGLLVTPGDRAALAAAIATLRDDGPRRLRMGDAARERALSRFTDAAMAKGYAAAYGLETMGPPFGLAPVPEHER
jgi:glycosyltransferase involved in cell wall biosynthesis